MIKVEGYKAFKGTMRITPKNEKMVISPFEIYGEWLYKPQWDMWYCDGQSYPDDICELLSEDDEKEKILKKITLFIDNESKFLPDIHSDCLLDRLSKILKEFKKDE